MFLGYLDTCESQPTISCLILLVNVPTFGEEYGLLGPSMGRGFVFLTWTLQQKETQNLGYLDECESPHRISYLILFVSVPTFWDEYGLLGPTMWGV